VVAVMRVSVRFMRSFPEKNDGAVPLQYHMNKGLQRIFIGLLKV
jgi:hypothetical protein